MIGENIIFFPARCAQGPSSPTAPVPGTRFKLYERATYYCAFQQRRIEGTIIQIQMDPLSGGQWRALLLTDTVTTWREISELKPCPKR